MPNPRLELRTVAGYNS